jgi:hypothetical protein
VREGSPLAMLGRASLVLARLLAPVVLLAALAAGILYVRLLNGPISLNFVAPSIAHTIGTEAGLAVDIEDASVALSDLGGLEFQLRNVRFVDAQGMPVAVAPLAAVQLSYRALWWGLIAPRRVVLIEPRLLVSYSEEQGLALSFTRVAADRRAGSPPGVPVSDGEAAADSSAVRSAAGDQPVSALRSINVAQTLAALAAEGRRQEHSAAFLKGLGLRNATVVFSHGGRQATWRLTEAEFGIDHRPQGSVIRGNITVAAPGGAWRVSFATRSFEQAQSVSLKASVHGLVPSTIARQVPELAEFAALDLPVDGQAELELSNSGELLGANFKLDLKRGNLLTPWLDRASVGIDSGSIGLRYLPAQRRLELEPSTVTWGESRVTLVGSVSLATRHFLGGDSWVVDVSATEGRLAAEEFGVAGVPLAALRARGLFNPGRRSLEITEFMLKAGEADITVAGTVAAGGSVPSVSLQGRMGPMPMATAKALWPAAVAPAARRWVGTQVLGGRVVAGNFSLEQGEAGTDRLLRAGTDAARLSVAIETADIEFVPHPGFLPVEAPRALVRLESQNLEVAVPEAAVSLGKAGKLSIRGGRLASSNAMVPTAIGELTFRVQGTAGAALAYLDQEALSAERPLGLSSDAVDGKAEAQFKIAVPLGERLGVEDLRIEGKGRVTEGRARNLLGGYDVHGATIVFEVTERAVDVTGDLLVSGVPARVAWQRIMGARADQQPPLRIRASLDAGDRSQLGIDVNHIVTGEMAVEVTVAARLRGQPPAMQIRGDLTNAELLIEGLAWRKPPGRSAFVQFDVVKTSAQQSELQNFKIVGEDIAIDGVLMLDGQGRVREFRFPEFSVKVVSRLAVEGKLRQDNVWDIDVRGTTFDGRDFFQSLYSVGQLRDRPLPDAKGRPGQDVRVEIDTVLGFSDLSLKGLRLQMSKRGGRIVSLIARGAVEGSGRGAAATTLEVGVQQTQNEPRKLVALADDAGQVFRLFGFYPNMQGGRMRLEVNLDGRGPAEKTGLLQVRQFNLLGDPVVYEVLQGPEGLRDPAAGPPRPQRTGAREQIPFDSMRAPFSVGHGQFVIEDADLRGPVLGAILKGKADFGAQWLDLGGTYVPLQGLNSAIGFLPGIGPLLAGPRGEGVLGMTYAIKGPMARPQVLVNPLSMALPGILREMMQMTNPEPRVTPREERSVRPGQAPAVRSSSTPASGGMPAQGAAEPRVDADGGWRSETVPFTGDAGPRGAPAAGQAPDGVLVQSPSDWCDCMRYKKTTFETQPWTAERASRCTRFTLSIREACVAQGRAAIVDLDAGKKK